MKLAERMTVVQGSQTSGMRNLAMRLRAEGKSVVNFAAGELDEGLSEVVINAARQAVYSGTNKYTETVGIRPLRDAIAARLERQTGLPWSWEEIAVTAGAKQALFNSAMVLFNPGDEVLVPAPYWTTFPTQISLTGAKAVFVDTADSGYRLTADLVARHIGPKSRAIIINTPNNPTGHVIPAEVLEQIAVLVRENGLWVIYDQCYSTFVYDDRRHVNLLEVAPDLKDRTVVVDSFSKSHALAGWRIGYAAAPKHVIQAVSNFQGHTTSNPNSIAQVAALAALESQDDDYHSAVRARLEGNRARGLEILKALRGVRVAAPEGGFYFYLKIPRDRWPAGSGISPDSGCTSLAERLLAEAQIAVVDGEAFGDFGGIRLSYAIDSQEVEAGLMRLVHCFQRHE